MQRVVKVTKNLVARQLAIIGATRSITALTGLDSLGSLNNGWMDGWMICIRGFQQLRS